MTAENNGVPEDDDPFAYLYRAENGADNAEGAAPTQPMPGVPRTSYQQATQVGRTQYGQSAYGQQSSYGQQPQPQPQPGYGQQAGGYAGVPHQAQPPAGGGGRAASRAAGGSGGTSRGVMIGAVAVVAAVAIGIGMALFNNSDKTHTGAGASSSSSSAATGTSAASAPASASAALPAPADAATAQIQGTAPQSDHTGAQAAGGKFVPLTAAGQSVTWQITVPSDGSYVLWLRYANAGADARVNVVVNGTTTSYPIRCSNWTHESDWSKAWFSSYVNVTLKAGANTVALSAIQGQPGVNLDQIGLNHSTTDRPWS